MSLSHKQKMYLHEMGITLWSKKTVDTNSINEQKTKEWLTISTDELASSTLFSDVLQLIGYSFGECSITKNSISCGLLSWSFTNSDEIQLQSNQLTTPNISVISNSALLKKQLWQQLSTLSIKD